ncbi:MAG: hypothetical protein IKF82_01280 [Bacilli bacterium]|nr:hypothetical protein [Bacilli bacterium]
MSNKAIINLSPEIDINSVQDGDILIYDLTKKEFNLVSQQVLFKRYDERIARLEKYISEQTKASKEFFAKTERIIRGEKEASKEFLLKYQDSNAKMIDMVKKFIGGEKEDV